METLLTSRAALLQGLYEGPAFGLELVARLRARTGGVVRLNTGGVYGTLRSLEGSGHVRSWTRIRGRGRPRRYYELTVPGVKAAEALRRSMALLIRRVSAPLRRDEGGMAERIRRAAEVSGFVDRLRRGVQAGGGRR
jgi:PadR family transcriptional regulator PadR